MLSDDAIDVILVDEQDCEVGLAPKLAAHRAGQLHRAFSIFIFQEMPGGGLSVLLQQRNPAKYHSGGLWTNACCSHPLPGEDVLTAARRRLQEEMGFVTDLAVVGNFIYREQLADLVEHEFDHVLVGFYAGPLSPHADEVSDTAWVSCGAVQRDLADSEKRGCYTAWFAEAFAIAYRYCGQHC